MPMQREFRDRIELAEYLERLGKAARESGNVDTAYGFEQSAAIVGLAVLETDSPDRNPEGENAAGG